MAADFTYEYNGDFVDNKYSATFDAPYYEDLGEGKNSVIVKVEANGITETAEIKIKDNLNIDLSVDKTEIIEGESLTVTVKEERNGKKRILDGASVIVKNGEKKMTGETGILGTVTFSGNDYDILSIESDTNCTIFAEKYGYNSSEIQDLKVKTYSIKIISPKNNDEFVEGVDITVIIEDENGNKVENVEITLGESSNNTDRNGIAIIKAPLVNNNDENKDLKAKKGRFTDKISLKIINGEENSIPVTFHVIKFNGTEQIDICDSAVKIKKFGISNPVTIGSTNETGYIHSNIDISPTGGRYKAIAEKDGEKAETDWTKLNLESNWKDVIIFESAFTMNENNREMNINFNYETINPLTPKVGDSIIFNVDSISIESMNTIFWSFGDGEISFEKNPEHIYKTAGTYTIDLYVENDGEYGHCSCNINIADNNERFCLTQFLSNLQFRLKHWINNRGSFKFSILNYL
jgi:hypothetical protein